MNPLVNQETRARYPIGNGKPIEDVGGLGIALGKQSKVKLFREFGFIVRDDNSETKFAFKPIIITDQQRKLIKVDNTQKVTIPITLDDLKLKNVRSLGKFQIGATLTKCTVKECFSDNTARVVFIDGREEIISQNDIEDNRIYDDCDRSDCFRYWGMCCISSFCVTAICLFIAAPDPKNFYEGCGSIMHCGGNKCP